MPSDCRARIRSPAWTTAGASSPLFGDYTVRAGNTSQKVTVSAAIGAAAWQEGASLRALLEAADADMYREKVAGSTGHFSPRPVTR